MGEAKEVSTMSTEDLKRERRSLKRLLFYAYYGNAEPTAREQALIARGNEVSKELHKRRANGQE